jgi:hypothetical protein
MHVRVRDARCAHSRDRLAIGVMVAGGGMITKDMARQLVRAVCMCVCAVCRECPHTRAVLCTVRALVIMHFCVRLLTISLQDTVGESEKELASRMAGFNVGTCE